MFAGERWFLDRRTCFLLQSGFFHHPVYAEGCPFAPAASVAGLCPQPVGASIPENNIGGGCIADSVQTHLLMDGSETAPLFPLRLHLYLFLARIVYLSLYMETTAGE